MKKTILIISAAVALATACTDLTEHLYSDISKDEFLSSPENLALYTSRPYTSLQAWGVEQGYWTLVLQIGNEVAVPKSYDGHWGEDRYVQLQTHKIESSNKLVRAGWEFCFNGIAACNDAIYELEKLEPTDATARNIAEIKVLRAYYYLLATDLFGQVPYSVDKAETGYPKAKSREEIVAWIEGELKDNMGKLEDVVSAGTYGRVTADVARFLLAKLYLNAEVYSGKARWSEAAAVCKEIMDSGNFRLAANYGDCFAINNEGCSEAVFAIPYSTVYTSHCFYPFVLTLNADLQKLYNVGDQWNGTHCGQPDFLARYDENDFRKKATWLYGDVYDASGKRWTVVDSYDASGNPVMKEYSLEDVNIPEECFGSGLPRYAGARIIKWPYQTDGSLVDYKVSMENDFILMRYADVVLMYVEALVRQGQTAQAEAVPEFIELRTRAGLAPLSGLTLDKLFEERQKEMALEGWVHNDLVRFGKYLEAWWAKPADSDARHILLPIPEEMLGSNPNLVQNPGY